MNFQNHRAIVYKFTTIVILVFISFGVSFSQQSLIKLENSKNSNFNSIKEAFDKYYSGYAPGERKGGWKQYKRWEYFWERRVSPTGEFPEASMLVNEMQKFYEKSSKKDKLQANSWRLLGPISNPTSEGSTREQGLGRINAIRFNPDDESEIWAGAATGGVWKSNDYGNSWSTFSFTQFLSLGVSDIAIAPSNPRIVYVATGDADGSSGTAQTFYSVGVIKTTDGGASWNITNLSHSLDNKRLVSRVLVHPNDPNKVLAAVSDGIQMTTDGGMTWKSVMSAGYIIDMEFMPDNPDVVYAASFSWSGNTGIFRSEDGGETWEQTETLTNALRIALGVSQANPNMVYALVSHNTTKGFHSFRVSTDKGKTWVINSTVGEVGNILGWYEGKGSDTGGQGQYDLCIAVSPENPDEVYIGGINVWKSEDAGISWQMATHWFGGWQKPFVHADFHDLVYNPSGSALYAGHDGGIDFTADNGESWDNITDGMSITQFYRIGGAATDENIVYGGSQDNGTSRLNSSGWTHVSAGDGMECAVDYTNAQRSYVSMYYGNFTRSTNGGKSFSTMVNPDKTGENGAWVAPLIIDPVKPSTIYAGFQNVWKSTDYGVKWSRLATIGSSSTLQSMAVAYDSKTIYAGYLKSLFVSHDGGATWESLLTSTSSISSIAVDPNNPKRIWITKSDFSPNDKVWEYTGTAWVNLSGNLPNVPINSVVYQKDSPDRLYIGTDIGVFYSDYSSAYWEQFGTGLPNVIVNELEIHYGSGKLRAATYGRGLWETEINTCNLEAPEISVVGQTEFCTGDSVIIESENEYPAYLWSNGATTKRIVIKEAGSYSLLYSDQNGCTAKSHGVHITVYPAMEMVVTNSGSNYLCEGDTISLTARLGFKSFLWNTGETSRKIKVYQPGKYFVKGYSNYNCVSESEVIDIIMVQKPPKPEIQKSGSSLITNGTSSTYQWYLDGKPIDGATQHTIPLDKIGNYSVEVFSDSGCGTMSDIFAVATGVDYTFNEGEFAEIYPNPVSGLLNININLENATECSISLTNQLGKSIYSENLTSTLGAFKTTINFETLPAGVYFMYINSGDRKIVRKIIKN